MGKPSRLKIGKHLGIAVQRIKAHMPADIGLEVFVAHKLALIGNAEPELAVGHRTTGQGLGGDNLSSGTTRRIGRSAVAVVERDQGTLDLVLTALVDRRMRTLGTAGDGRRGGKRTGTVIGNGDRHGTHGVVVGVTGLAVILLGYGVREGLACVSLRKLDLMASQDVDQADRCLCRRRGLEVVDSGQQAKRVGRGLVGRLHGKRELTLGHRTSGEALAELEAAGRGVVKLSAVRVGEASVFLLGDIGGQVALAVLGHGHFGGCDMRVIRHADRAARVLANLVLIGSSGCVVNLAELDGGDAVLRVLLAHGCGCGIGQRGAFGGGDGKAELVPIRPVAAADDLAQVKVELRIERGHAVGVLESRSRGVLQDMLGLEGAVAVVRDGGLDGVLGIAVGDALAGGSALGLAQRVGVLAGLGVLHGAHRDVAAGVVGAGGDDLVALDELEGELAGGKLAPGQGLGRDDLVGDAGALGRHGVGVLELNLLDVLGALQLMRGHKLALAIVGDGRHDGIDGFVVGDAAGIALDLAQRIDVLTDLGVLDGAERNVAVGIILNGFDNRRVLALTLNELKGELIVLELMAGQDLGNCNLIGDARLSGIGGIGVLELDLARGLLHRSLELSLCVGCHRYGELCNVLAVGDAVDRGPGMLLANLVDIRARLVIGNLAKANVRMALGCKRSRGPGHRGVVLGRQTKLKLVLIRPLATLEHLGQAKVGSCQRCRRGIERKANLAVIAQVDIDLRRTRNNLRVVPLGIDHVACGVRRVSAHTLLGGVELVDKGEARGASLNRPVIAILYQSTFKVFELASLNRDRNGIIVRRARRVLRHKLIFVPIGLRARRLFRCELGASRVCVDGR